jgi:hypothetical protein
MHMLNHVYVCTDWLSTRPGAVGRVPKNYSKTDLPFMFKVLSVKTALSIQVGAYVYIIFESSNSQHTKGFLSI